MVPLAWERVVAGGAKVAEWIRTLAYRLYAMIREWLDIGLVRDEADPLATNLATLPLLRNLDMMPMQP